ncbi:hypothetical protein F444_21608, partial [Phytophthora nicotianae P1976]
MSESKPEVHVPSTGMWEYSPIAKECHESWEAFKEYLVVCQEDTHQLFRLRSSTSVARCNAEIQDQARAGANGGGTSAKYIGTHGWYRKGRSTGQRKSYFGKSMECKAGIKAAVTWNKEERKFMVRVTGSSTSHNHRVDRTVYENHPS